MKIRKLLSMARAYLDIVIFAVPALILTVILAVAARSAKLQNAPNAVYADSHDNSSANYSSNAQASQENEGEESVNSKNIKIYTIRLLQDKIAIFEGEAEEPVYVLETSTAHLPDTDRRLLEQGIRADSLDEAYRLIED